MQTKIKKIAIFSTLFFVVGFVGAFLGKGFERTKLGRTIEKRLGIVPEVSPSANVSQGSECGIKQQEDGNEALFVGCNGFF